MTRTEDSPAAERWRPYSFLAVAYLLAIVVAFFFGRVDMLDPATSGMTLSRSPGVSWWTVREVVPGGPADRAGLEAGDRVLGIRNVYGWEATADRPRTRGAQSLVARPGQPLVVTVRDRSGTRRVTLDLARAREIGGGFDWTTFVAALLVGLLYLGVGGALIALRPTHLPGLLLGGFLLSVPSIAMPTPATPPGLKAILVVLHVARNWLLLTSIFHFALVFPEPVAARRRRVLLGVLYSLFFPILLSVGSFWIAVAYDLPGWFEPPVVAPLLQPFSFGFICLYIVASGAALLLQHRNVRSEDSRRRLRVVLLGFCATFGILLVATLAAYLLLEPKSAERMLSSPIATVVLLLVLGIFPAAVAYAVVKHRMFGLRVILRAGLRHALARRVLLTLLAIPVLVLFYEIGRYGPDGLLSVQSLRLVPLVLLIVVVATFRERILTGLDRRFFREAYDARRALLNLADRFRVAPDRDTLTATLADGIERALRPEAFHVYFRTSDGAYRSWSRPESTLEPAAVDMVREEDRALRLAPRGPLGPVRSLGSAVTALAGSGAELLVPLRDREGALRAVAVLGPKLSGEPYGREDVDLTVTVANQFAAALDNLRLADEVRSSREAEERLRREIDLAREVQLRLLPERAPVIAGTQIAGTCHPARTVGGDYFDFVPLDRARLGVAVADVSGKGLAAAMLMSNLQAGLRAALGAGVDIEEAVRAVNGLLCELTAENRFASFFFGVLERETETLRYLNAGHNAPLILREDGEVRRLLPTAPILGVVDPWEGRAHRVSLGRGEVLLAYTDGLSEAATPEAEEFGEARIVRAAQAAIRDGADAEATARSVLSAVSEFRGGSPAIDDLTLVVVRII